MKTTLGLRDADRKDATMSEECVYSDNNNTNNVKNSSRGYPGGSVLKNPPANTGDSGSVPGSGRSPGEGDDDALQYSCLGNSMYRGAWRAIILGVAKNLTRLSN